MACTLNECQYWKLYGDCPSSCYQRCPGICDAYFDAVSYPPPPPPPPSPTINQYNHSRPISTNLVIMAGVLGGAFFLGVCWILVLNFYSKWKSSRRRRMVNSPMLNDTREDFADGNHGPVVEHHIWYINTVGLQQSVIDSITVCKYRKDEGLIEGTDCSVCLSEFQTDETLRLLPKCSHAFHLPCIDTWLRSHTNCPLCRAPVVHESRINSLENLENSDDLDSREGSDQMENLHVGENGTSEVRSTSGDFSSCPIEIGRLSNFVKGNSPHIEARNSAVRVQSDLGNNRRALEQLEHEMQPVRRSVSLDLSSASVIYGAMANVGEQEGSSHSHSELVQVNNENSSGSSILYKMMKSSSIGRSLQKKHSSSMKRSFSSSGKLVVPKHSRSKTSILPF